MESATIESQKNVSLDSGATFLHPCNYCYQNYVTVSVTNKRTTTRIKSLPDLSINAFDLVQSEVREYQDIC